MQPPNDPGWRGQPNYPQRPPFYNQSTEAFRQPHPPMYPPPPGPSPKKSRKRLWLIIAGVVLVMALCGGVMNALGLGATTQTTQATPTSTPQPATPTPGPLSGPVFGGTQEAFTAKYGKPQDDIGGLYFYQNLQVGVIGDRHLIDNLLVGVPKGQTWSIATGITQCNSFLPRDAQYERDFATADVDKLNDGFAKIYISQALSHVFSVGQFTDQQHHPITVGTFTVAYSYLFNQSKNVYNSSQFLQCEIDPGIPDYLKTFTIAATPTSKPQPMPTQRTGVNGNPWGYDFSVGNLIYNPPADFCSYFACISNFDNGRGFVNECRDGMYSKSGGIRGDCSYHNGEWRPLYAH